jgi:hypothetical protein
MCWARASSPKHSWLLYSFTSVERRKKSLVWTGVKVWFFCPYSWIPFCGISAEQLWINLQCMQKFSATEITWLIPRQIDMRTLKYNSSLKFFYTLAHENINSLRLICTRCCKRIYNNLLFMYNSCSEYKIAAYFDTCLNFSSNLYLSFPPCVLAQH